MFQKLIVMGRMTKDPNQINGGCSFSIAYNKKIKGEEKTTFFDCVAFGKTAENIISYCRKGRMILIEGEVSLNEYMTKDGNKRSSLSIMCNSVTFINSGEKREENHYNNQAPQFQNIINVDNDKYKPFNLDDIPF